MASSNVAELVGKLTRGQISRREFLARTSAAGVAASFVGAGLADGASAAPANRNRVSGSLNQADATTLVIADALNGGAWLNLDPGQFYEINPQVALTIIYDTLYWIPDGSAPTDIQPLLAEGPPEVSEDGLTVTIKIKPGVKFHTSGNEMTANDWVFSWNRLKFGAAQSAFLGSDYWTSVTAVDPTTLQLTLPAPNAALSAILTSSMLSVMDSARVIEFGGTDAEPTGDDPANSPEVVANQAARDIISGDSVGTGPFKVVQFDLDSEIIVERNPDYWGEAPLLERIIWRNTNEANAQVQLVQTGEADIAYALPIDLIESVSSDPNLQVLSGSTLALQYMAMNLREEYPTSNPLVRQAISRAIDYDGIISGIMGGAAVRPAAPVPLPLAGSEAVEPKKYTLDLAAAQQLWDESGVGEISIDLSYDTDSPAQGGASLEAIAVKVQSDLQQINGLTVNLTPMPGAERIAAYRAGEFFTTLSPWTPDYPDAHTYAEPFGRTGVAAAARVGFSNEEVDALLDQGLTIFDPVERDAVYARIQEILIETAVYLILYQPVDQKVARSVVQGVKLHPVNMIDVRAASKTE